MDDKDSDSDIIDRFFTQPNRINEGPRNCFYQLKFALQQCTSALHFILVRAIPINFSTVTFRRHAKSEREEVHRND